ncbi:hypothetical protein K4749_04330 [Streptomyces sp. TRM72054]|uniref:DUF6233 domain-containing protein n=1 Tax=Streptomyces sp. TRM72054 TaxID=2870562 RepID=UPI001C8B8A0D|nr:DUF6233 domain-containing protein [Streptomyces sp. TRM72054]MBX9392833.1 hypothetical protein [Streptomyces sp. TRM72054]
MNEVPPPRLELLRFARKVSVQQATAGLAQIDRWIADEERREAQRRVAEARRPPPPEWLIDRSPGGRHPMAVHTGDCHMAGKYARPATQQEARRALADSVPACTHCRPDTAPGILD